MKTVLITGAFGGMGREAVKLFSESGYRVLALDVACPIEPLNDFVVPIVADITDKASIERAFTAIKEGTDKIDAIIHFAGIYMLNSLVEISSEEFEKIFAVNLYGAFLVNKTFLPLLSAGSKILMTTSELATLDPLPFTGVYAVTKAALDKYAYSLAMELQLLGISVSVLRAGAVSTGMLGVSIDGLNRFCANTQLYSCNAKRFRNVVNRVEARSVEPSRVAKLSKRIVEKKSPAFAYAINKNLLLLLLSILPKRMQLEIIKLILK